jgi:tetratricopeptide (TPR) repeat protein
MEPKKIFENAQRLFLEGRFKESINTFSVAIETGEKTEIAYLSRGVAYLKTKQEEKAIADFSKAVTMNEENMRAHFYRGIAYMTAEEYREAITDFDKTIQLKPDNGAAFIARGTAYAQIGNQSEANKNIKTAIAFSEENICGLQETVGLWRAQFDRAMMVMKYKEQLLHMSLWDDEMLHIEKLPDQEKYH